MSPNGSWFDVGQATNAIVGWMGTLVNALVEGSCPDQGLDPGLTAA
jgi:hypothetical protein